MLRIFTDYSDTAFSLDDFALFANWFDWWSNLHSNSPFRYAPFPTWAFTVCVSDVYAQKRSHTRPALLRAWWRWSSFWKEPSEYTRSVFYLKTSAARKGI